METQKSAMEGAGAEDEAGMDKAFWKNKRVLLTGHTGFKGSWLCSWLLDMGASVSGIGLEPMTKPALFQELELDKRMHSYIDDIRDVRRLHCIIQEEKPEIIFHLAAQPIVRTAYKDPVYTYETNVMGTVHLLEAVRHSSGVRAVVNITTDKVYENREWFWGYREEDSLNGYDPYSNSKSCSELVTSSYVNSFFSPEKYKKEHNVAIATARAGNVIGGGDWAVDRIIPDCVRALEENHSIELRNPDAVRPWQHVLEPLYGYLLLAQRLYEVGAAYNGPYNFGPEESDCIPVIEVVKEFEKQYQKKLSVILAARGQPHEANFLKLDCSKAKKILGWKPRLGIQKGIEMTAEYYRIFYSKNKKPSELMKEQIEKYIGELI